VKRTLSSPRHGRKWASHRRHAADVIPSAFLPVALVAITIAILIYRYLRASRID
jgi:hypothetical protein